jgi:ABC-type transport system involved in cytochrome c biogenesis ATPase subunit
MATSIRLKRLRIEQLFDSHDIDIAFRLEERVTVLHGRNGSGKTVTLKLIAALREGRYEELGQYPFARLILEASDGSRLTIEPERSRESLRLPFLLQRPDQRKKGELMTILKVIARRSHRGRARSGQSDEVIDLDADRVARAEFEPSLHAFLEALPPAKFIPTDRLFVREPGSAGDPMDVLRKISEKLDFMDDRSEDDEPRPKLMVERLSEEIRAIVNEADQAYRLISTRLDSSLRQRIFHPPENPLPLEDLVARNQVLREKEARLQSLGLLRESPGAVDEAVLTNEQQRGMFHILLDDLSQKLAPFDDLTAKAGRLLKSLNTKLAPKQVRLDVETGYQVTTASGQSLPLERLSSGEQHELVLLHELLFDLDPGTLVLIDEPELSLHVTWQEMLVPELMEIAQLAQLDFVLATHSPFIVGDDHAHLMVRLGEPQP